MKKSLLAALLGAALWSPWAAHAEEMQAPQSYLKLGVGQSHLKVDGASADKTSAAIAFGQMMSPTWGYEVGYLHVGKWSGSETDGNVTDSVSLRTQALYAAVVGNLPLSDSFSLFGKLGVTANRSKVSARETDNGTTPPTVERFSDKTTKVQGTIGIGVAYNFTKDVAAIAEYQYFGKADDGDLKLQAWTVGVKYGF